jgi:hypothetical protein
MRHRKRVAAFYSPRYPIYDVRSAAILTPHPLEDDRGMACPRQADIRYRVDPRDVPPEKAARRLHLTLARFNELLPNVQVNRKQFKPHPLTGQLVWYNARKNDNS